MKYTVEIASGGIIYVPSFIKIDSGVRKLLAWGYTYRHTDGHTQQGDLISLCLDSFNIRKVG
jgi:hypothetical protein